MSLDAEVVRLHAHAWGNAVHISLPQGPLDVAVWINPDRRVGIWHPAMVGPEMSEPLPRDVGHETFMEAADAARAMYLPQLVAWIERQGMPAGWYEPYPQAVRDSLRGPCASRDLVTGPSDG